MPEPNDKPQNPPRTPDNVGLIFAVQPDYPGWGHGESHRLFWSGALRKGSPYMGRVYQDRVSASFPLGDVFLASVLNAQESGMDVTHIAALHNDVVPEPGWLDILLEELIRTGADMLSVLLPIKDLMGLSSTAIDSDDPYCVERRVTMREAHRLPETFSAADCGYPDRPLLANTGCFVMRYDQPWRLATDASGNLLVQATSTDRLQRRKDGKWEAAHSPSDWYFSRQIQRLGGKVLVTRKVRCLHMGDMPYTNYEGWGEWEWDVALQEHFGGVPIGGSGNGNGDDKARQVVGAAERTA